MSTLATAQTAPNSALASIQELITKAQSGAVNHLVDQRFVQAFAGILPQLKTTMESEAGKHLGKLQTAGTAVVDAVSKAEAGLSERVRQLTIDTLAELAPRQVVCVTPEGLTLGKPKTHVRPEFDEIAGVVMLGLHVLMCGPAGSGKTTLARQLADALGLRFAFISLTAGISESHLIGRFAPIGEAGRFVYVPAAFVDFYENGGLFLLDEVDAADPNVMLTLNAAMANGHMATPNPEKPIIKRHKDFRLIAAANTWGSGADRQYVGRNQLDASTLDRFCAAQFEIDYDETFETNAGQPQVVAYFHEVRRRVRDMKIRRVVSTRIILDGSLRLRAGHSIEQVKRSFFLSWTEAERNAVGYSPC